MTISTRLKPYDDPAILTAEANAASKLFTDILHRSRKAGGHEDDALKSDRPLNGFLPRRPNRDTA